MQMFSRNWPRLLGGLLWKIRLPLLGILLSSLLFGCPINYNPLISGRVIDNTTGEPVKDVQVRYDLSQLDSTKFTRTTFSASDGSFYFPMTFCTPVIMSGYTYFAVYHPLYESIRNVDMHHGLFKPLIFHRKLEIRMRRLKDIPAGDLSAVELKTRLYSFRDWVVPNSKTDSEAIKRELVAVAAKNKITYYPPEEIAEVQALDKEGIRYFLLFDYKKATEVYLRARNIAEKLDLNVQNNENLLLHVADFLMQSYRGDFNKQEAVYLRLIATEEKVFGPEDKRLMSPLTNYAGFVRGHGVLGDKGITAMKAYERALAIGEKNLKETQHYYQLGSLETSINSVLKPLEELYRVRGEPRKLSELSSRKKVIITKFRNLEENKCQAGGLNCPSGCYNGPSGCSGDSCTADVICAPKGYDPWHNRK